MYNLRLDFFDCKILSIDIFNKAKLDNLIDKNKFLGYLICHFGILFEFCIMFDIVILLIITYL